MKYVLHIIDLRSENPWDNKAVYLLYTELITGIKQIVPYFSFATLIWFITFDNKKWLLISLHLYSLGFIKTILYSCFMVIMIKVHTFPLFAIRPMYLTLRWVVMSKIEDFLSLVSVVQTTERTIQWRKHYLLDNLKWFVIYQLERIIQKYWTWRGGCHQCICPLLPPLFITD